MHLEKYRTLKFTRQPVRATQALHTNGPFTRILYLVEEGEAHRSWKPSRIRLFDGTHRQQNSRVTFRARPCDDVQIIWTITKRILAWLLLKLITWITPGSTSLTGASHTKPSAPPNGLSICQRTQAPSAVRSHFVSHSASISQNRELMNFQKAIVLPFHKRDEHPLRAIASIPEERP